MHLGQRWLSTGKREDKIRLIGSTGAVVFVSSFVLVLRYAPLVKITFGFTRMARKFMTIVR